MTGLTQPLAIRWAAWRFRSQRADYYEFLAQYLTQARSDRTLLEIFQQDALRHGLSSPRGRLSAWWAWRYLACGGDLLQTWQQTLPVADLRCIGLAQDAGQSALVLTLQALAGQIRITQRSTQHFWQTLTVGLVAFVVALAVLFVMPLFAAPRLVQAFSVVPASLYGSQTQRLMAWADLIQSHGWLLVLVAFLAFALWVWSFGQVVGPVRQVMDRMGPWQLYRDMQAIRFLMMTATLLRTLQQRGVTLRYVLLVQHGCANRWVSWHLQQMVARIDRGMDPLDALQTGLISDQARWCLLDVVRVRGLSDGLLTASAQISEQITVSMAARAVVWRWLLLVVAVGVVFAVAAWHVEVIEEMRRALTLMYGF